MGAQPGVGPARALAGARRDAGPGARRGGGGRGAGVASAGRAAHLGGQRGVPRPTFAETLTFSADPLAYFVPGQYSTVFGGLAPRSTQHVWGTIPLEKMVFPGWSLWVLGLLGLVRAWPQTRLWLNVLLVSLVLSLGPVLHVAGQGLPVPLPYLLFYQLPGVEVSRTPVRFALLVQIALAVRAGLWAGRPVAAAGAAPPAWNCCPRATQVLELRVPSVKPPLLVGRAAGADHGGAGDHPARRWRPAAVSAFYQTLARDPVRSALLEVPIGDPDPAPPERLPVYQTVHQQPIVGGVYARARPLTRSSRAAPASTSSGTSTARPSIVAAAARQRSPTAAARSAARALLQANKVRYIVLHKTTTDPAALSHRRRTGGADQRQLRNL